jgi:hypothetical protein
MKDSNEWEIVSTYSTKEAVADGFLVKVDSKASEEAGIKFPVYLTRKVWDKYVEVPKGMEQLQNLSGRLWDVLFMFAFHARNVSSNFLQYDFSATYQTKATGNQTKSWKLRKIVLTGRSLLKP